MTAVFLDTGFLIALEASDDQHHEQALAAWTEFARQPLPLVTTSYVMDETVTFFNAHSRHIKAVEIGAYLLSSPSVQFIEVDHDLFMEGWSLFQQHQDKRYSLTDCISFAVMQRLEIDTALAFDRHFVQAGFRII